MSDIERDRDWTIYFRDGSLIPPAVHPGHNRRDQVGWERMEVVRADAYRGAVDHERALAEAILSLADSAGMPDSFRETDSRMILARETLDRLGGQ
jgi:hypothetical protein